MRWGCMMGDRFLALEHIPKKSATFWEYALSENEERFGPTKLHFWWKHDSGNRKLRYVFLDPTKSDCVDAY